MILAPPKHAFLPLLPEGALHCQGPLLIEGTQTAPDPPLAQAPATVPTKADIIQIVDKTLQSVNPNHTTTASTITPSKAFPVLRSPSSSSKDIKHIVADALQSAVPAPASNILLKSTIRHAVSKDLNAIRHFTNTLLKTSYSLAFFLQFLYAKDSFCLLMTLPPAAAGSLNIVGVITGKLESSQKRDDAATHSGASTGHVYTLAVDPDYRRMGAASQLLSEFEIKLACHALNQDCVLSSLTLEVEPKNTAAVAFYDRNKFKPCAPLKKGYYGGAGDAQQMKKVLL